MINYVNSIQCRVIKLATVLCGTANLTYKLKEERCEAACCFMLLFVPSVQAQLVGKICQSFFTICITISKELCVCEYVSFPQYNINSMYLLLVKNLLSFIQ